MPRRSRDITYVRTDALLHDHEGSGVTTVGYIYDKPREWCRDRRLDEYAFVWLLEGAGRFVTPQLPERAVAAGDVLLLFPGIVHSYGRGEQPLWSECYAMYRGPLFDQLVREGVVTPEQPLLSPGLDPELMAEFQRFATDFRDADDRAQHVLAGRMLTFICALAAAHQRRGREQRGTDFIAVACVRLGENLELPMDYARLAAGFGLSYERFRKVFTTEVGLPPARWRQQRRIERAKELLIAGRLTLPAIAERLGFCDQYFFSRQFTSATGRPPARFRRDFGAER